MLLVKIAVAICHNGISNDIENDHDFFRIFNSLMGLKFDRIYSFFKHTFGLKKSLLEMRLKNIISGSYQSFLCVNKILRFVITFLSLIFVNF